MQYQKKQFGAWPYIISLVASVLIGIDIFVFFYIYGFHLIGIAGALCISTCGLLLNAYLYYLDGPENLIDFWSSTNKTTWSRIFDVVSLLGGLLIFVFTYYVYAEAILVHPFLAFWFTPFLVTTMALADGLGTLTMNKSGFLHLLAQYPFDEFKEALRVWGLAIKDFVIKVAYNGNDKLDFEAFFRIMNLIIMPISLAVVVTYAFTRTYLLGSLAVVQGSFFAFILTPVIWIAAIAFFLGELYFVCEQNIMLVSYFSEHNSMFVASMWAPVLAIMVAANALANGLVALDASVLVLTGWAGIRFGFTCIQNFMVMTNKCNQYPGLDHMNGGQTKYVLSAAAIIMSAILLVYIIQLPLSRLAFPVVGSLPALVLLLSFLLFLALSTLGCKHVLPEPKFISKSPLPAKKISSNKVPIISEENSDLLPLDLSASINSIGRT